MAVTPEEGGLPAGVTEKYDPQNLIREEKNVDLVNVFLKNLSELVDAPAVAPPPGTVIQSRVQVSPGPGVTKADSFT